MTKDEKVTYNGMLWAKQMKRILKWYKQYKLKESNSQQCSRYTSFIQLFTVWSFVRAFFTNYLLEYYIFLKHLVLSIQFFLNFQQTVTRQHCWQKHKLQAHERHMKDIGTTHKKQPVNNWNIYATK